MLDPATFTGPAVATFGNPALEQAYTTIASLVAKGSTNPAVINKPSAKVTPADLSQGKSLMDPAAARDWDRFAANPVDPNARAALYAFALYGWNGNGFSVRAGVTQPAVRIGGAAASVDAGRLVLTFAVTQDVRLNGPGRKYAKDQIKRDLTFWLVKGTTSARPWVIDGWRSESDSVTVSPDVR